MDAKKVFRAGGLPLVVLSVLISSAPSGAADAGEPGLVGIQVGTFGGTTGFGFEGAVRINEFCQARAGHSNLGFGVSSTYREIPYHYESDISWTCAMLDFIPGTGRFHFSAGAFLSDTEVEITAFTEDPLIVGSQEYTPDQLGEIHGSVAVPEIAPYFGVGFGNRPAADAGIHMILDLGVIFQDYTVDLWHEGGSLPPELDQQLSQDIEVEQAFLQEQFDRMDVYPVVSMSLTCRF